MYQKWEVIEPVLEPHHVHMEYHETYCIGNSVLGPLGVLKVCHISRYVQLEKTNKVGKV